MAERGVKTEVGVDEGWAERCGTWTAAVHRHRTRRRRCRLAGGRQDFTAAERRATSFPLVSPCQQEHTGFVGACQARCSHPPRCSLLPTPHPASPCLNLKVRRVGFSVAGPRRGRPVSPPSQRRFR
jgi:hypothetical protein